MAVRRRAALLILLRHLKRLKLFSKQSSPQCRTKSNSAADRAFNLCLKQRFHRSIWKQHSFRRVFLVGRHLCQDRNAYSMCRWNSFDMSFPGRVSSTFAILSFHLEGFQLLCLEAPRWDYDAWCVNSFFFAGRCSFCAASKAA